MSELLDWLIGNEPAFTKSRLPSLYSDLSIQKSTNPEGYAANVTTWQTALTHTLLAGRLPGQGRLVLDSSEELLNALASHQYGRPSGLGFVLDDSIHTGKLLELSDFLHADDSIYHQKWLLSPWTVLNWGLKQTGLLSRSSYDQAGRLKSGQLVIVAALEAISQKVAELRSKLGQGLTDRVIARDTFVTELTRLCEFSLSTRDVEVLLRYLNRDKSILSYNDNTIKFTSRSSVKPEPITHEDVTIASLKSLIANLELQCSTLGERIARMQENAQAAVKTKNRQSALSALRSKKLCEGSLQQRVDTLHQLEEVYLKIEQAVDQVHLVEIMHASASVLTGLNKQVGSVERVEHVMDELRQQSERVDEVGQVLQEPLDGKLVVDDAEVDDELEALEKEETRLREDREAELTRERLQELDNAESVAREESERQQVENKLRESIEQLDQLGIDDTENSAAKTAKVPEHT